MLQQVKLADTFLSKMFKFIYETLFEERGRINIWMICLVHTKHKYDIIVLPRCVLRLWKTQLT